MKLDSIDKDLFIESFSENRFFQPLFVKIKPSIRCNLRCVKCNYWRKAVRDELTTDEVLSLIDQLSELHCRTIKFSGGEVLLRKDIFVLLKHAKEKGIATSITSNGTLIDRTTATRLIEGGLNRITISIDSHEPEIHDKIVGVKGSWKKSTAAIKNLKESAETLKRDFKITIATVVSKLNFTNTDMIVDLAKEMGADNIDFIALVQVHLGDSSLFMSPGDIRYFQNVTTDRILAKIKKFGTRVVNQNPFCNYEHTIIRNGFRATTLYKNIPCFVPWYHFFVHYNGDVVPCCCNKKYVVGNIRQEKLKNIVNNVRFVEFRKLCKPPIRNRRCYYCLDEVENNLSMANWLGC